MKTVFAVIGVIVVFFLAIGGMLIYLCVAGGYVASVLWSWYLVPLGAKAIGWKVFVASSLALSALRPTASSPVSDKKPDKSQLAGQIIGVLIGPWFALFIGWAIR